MYKNIAIPVSLDEERDFAHAVAIARKLADDGARITFIHVLEQFPGYVMDAIPPESVKARHDMAVEKLREISEGVDNAHSIILEGQAGRAVADWAKDNGADCIVIASHRPQFSDIFLGSTAAWVVRHADCAVHVLR